MDDGIRLMRCSACKVISGGMQGIDDVSVERQLLDFCCCCHNYSQL